MILKIILCIACVELVALGVVNGKSVLVQPHHPGSSTAVRTPLIPRGGLHDARNLLNHQHPFARRPNSTSVRSGGLGKGRGSVHVCSLCPAAYDIAPCVCQCLNDTAAMLICGVELSSCSQLTEVMSLTTYPVNTYLRLVVADTTLGCILEKDLWGPLAFQEILITNNRFQVLDNRAFQPFSATLTALNLEGNSLRDVYYATLSDTPLLRLLTLKSNFLDNLPGYSAITLRLLEIFDASYNQIKEIRPQTFAGMPKLRKIDLSHNAITKVSANAFTIPDHDSSSLVVNLANNLISFIEPKLLEGVHVCNLDLRNNHLTILSEDVFRPIIDFTKAASIFWTNNNPFDCDSQFCWIALNNTVSESFKTVLCHNLNNDPVHVLVPMCAAANATATPQPSRSRPRVLPN